MDSTILTFGIVKEIFKSSEKKMELHNGITIGELKNKLESAYPELKKIHTYLIAVNDEYAEDNLIIRAGDEIAIIPPVSGG